MTQRLVSLRGLLLVLLSVSTAAGCTQAPSQQVRVQRAAEPTEPAWDAQVEQVRSGNTRRIQFTSQPVAPDQWRMLEGLGDSLEALDVDVSRLTSSDWRVLGECPELRRLKLVGPVDDEALHQISSASELTILNLPDGVFSDAGLQRLASMQKLELLRFGSPHVTDAGLAVIPHLESLRFLHLINVPVTDEGLAHLQQTKHLESFYLDGGHCTDEGLYALLEALPGLHFHRDQLHLPEDPHAHPHEDTAGRD